MIRKKISTDEYVKKLNEVLREHEDYETGMKFLAHTLNSTGKGIRGYTDSGPLEKKHVYIDVETKIKKNFCIEE